MAFGSYMYPGYGYNPMPQFSQPSVQPVQPPAQTAQQPGSGNPQPGFYCRPVASKEEALGVPVDFMGNPMFFPDLAHNVIYVKRFNTSTGGADVFEFYNRQVPEKPEQVEYAPRAELNSLRSEVEALKKQLEEAKASKKPAGKGGSE